MTWIFHDSYKTSREAEKTGDDIVKLGFALGIKITRLGKKSKPYMMYILPIKKGR